jgi:predicted dehydrogenase
MRPTLHTHWTVRAFQAGKHVLCEKPFATSPADAARCFDAAEAGGRTVVEGFMWRHHPRPSWPAGCWPKGRSAGWRPSGRP